MCSLYYLDSRIVWRIDTILKTNNIKKQGQQQSVSQGLKGEFF